MEPFVIISIIELFIIIFLLIIRWPFFVSMYKKYKASREQKKQEELELLQRIKEQTLKKAQEIDNLATPIRVLSAEISTETDYVFKIMLQDGTGKIHHFNEIHNKTLHYYGKMYLAQTKKNWLVDGVVVMT